ncbi:MAG: glycosyltransferase family 1 protein [Acidimicrobiales bacterium]
MRLALDATPLLGARTGVGTFVAGALDALSVRPEMTVTAYALSWRGRTTLREVLPAGVTSGWAVPAGPLLRLWAHSGLVPAEWIADAEDGIEVVHGTNFVVPPTRRAARVVTVHDLTCVRFPELCAPTSLRYPALIRRAIGRGAFVHAPSAHVAAEVCEAFGADPERVVAVHHGLGVPGDDDAAGEPGATAPDGLRLAQALTGGGVERYVLALGTVEPRKDFALLVRAFDRIATGRPDVGLIIAGPDGWGGELLEQALGAARHRTRIGRAGYVDGPTRIGLLAGATVFAFPSVYEGFGLPPLEAMAAGVPVVATATGAVAEVSGGLATLVAVGDEEGLADAMAAVLDDRPGDQIDAARAHAASFTWSRCANGLASLYSRAAADR